MSDSIRPTPTGAGATSAPDDDWKAKALLIRAQRQTLIASNIANADTPHYRARDIDFSAALEQATRSLPTTPLATTSPQHLAADVGVQQRSTLEFVQFVRPAQTNLDGNTVDLDRERAAFAQNAILYQLAVTSLDELKEFKQASADPRR